MENNLQDNLLGLALRIVEDLAAMDEDDDDEEEETSSSKKEEDEEAADAWEGSCTCKTKINNNSNVSYTNCYLD